MSKKHGGRRCKSSGTYKARLLRMIERGEAFQVRNMLQPRRRKQK